MGKQTEKMQLLWIFDVKHGRGHLDGPNYFCDYKCALQLCLEDKQMCAYVYTHDMMHMQNKAIILMLQITH
jgi:hypothetical protein